MKDLEHDRIVVKNDYVALLHKSKSILILLKPWVKFWFHKLRLSTKNQSLKSIRIVAICQFLVQVETKHFKKIQHFCSKKKKKKSPKT